MDVQDARRARAECDVHRTVVQLVIPYFVEPQRHVERLRRRDGGAVCGVEVGSQGSGGDCVVPDAAFEEVAGQGALGHAEQLRPGLEPVDLGKNGLQPLEVAAVIAFSWLELRHGQVDERGHETKGSAAGTRWARLREAGYNGLDLHSRNTTLTHSSIPLRVWTLAVAMSAL